MESTVYAETAGVVEEIVAGAGQRVETHDLVVVINADA